MKNWEEGKKIRFEDMISSSYLFLMKCQLQTEKWTLLQKQQLPNCSPLQSELNIIRGQYKMKAIMVHRLASKMKSDCRVGYHGVNIGFSFVNIGYHVNYDVNDGYFYNGFIAGPL